MSTREKSLPDGWVERIWSALRATYGAAFDRQWQCPAGEDPARHVATLKAHWARELGGFLDKPEAIRYALDTLTDQPPNLVQFRAACNRAPTAAVLALPAPTPDPKRVSEAIGALRTPAHKPAKAWAYQLRARELQHGGELPSGRLMGLFHRAAWREALQTEMLNGSPE